MPIRIVTDSACDVPAELAAALAITVVPVYINIGRESYLDGVELTRESFYENLAGYPQTPTTAAPASGAFAAAFAGLAAEGATEILSLHIASSLSATYNAARLGAEATPGVEVTLFDTQQLTMAAGLLVIEAAKAAAAGASMAELVSLLETLSARTQLFAALDTLEFLRRSGRVSWAQFGLGTLLRIKPLINVHRSEITVTERVRTWRRSRERLLGVLRAASPLEHLSVLHTGASEDADRFLQEAGDSGPVTPAAPVLITPAIGSHVGPGAIGFACITAENGAGRALQDKL
jgi:fatty acid kinase fatty acid binding subunit